MSNRLRRRWERALTLWRGRLWLNQWRFSLEEGVVEGAAGTEEALVEIRPNAEYEIATLTVNTELLKETSEQELGRAACHEMVHLVLAPIGHLVSTMVEELPPQKRRGWGLWWETEHEKTTTHLTNLFLESVSEWRVYERQRAYRERK